MVTLETLPLETQPGAAVELTALDIVLWGVLPYVMVVVLVGGLVCLVGVGLTRRRSRPGREAKR